MLVRKLARSAIASMFVAGGLEVLKEPEPRVRKAKALLVPLGVPEEYVSPLTLADAVAKVGAGAALATGKLPRTAALVLAVSLVPTTLAGHRFWEHDDPKERANHRLHFLKNVALCGALVITSLDVEGRESIPHRVARSLPWAGR